MLIRQRLKARLESRSPTRLPACDSIPLSPRTLGWHFYGDESGRMLIWNGRMRFSKESYMRNLGGMNLGDNLGRQRHVAERFLDHIAVSFFSFILEIR
jgi:hypothetical protein